MADNFTIESKDNITVVSSSGNTEKLDGIVSPELKAYFVKLNADGASNMVFDISGFRYCDSSGLSAVLIGNRLCGNSEGTFVLAGPQPMVEKLITISQLNNVLNITPNVADAIELIENQ